DGGLPPRDARDAALVGGGDLLGPAIVGLAGRGPYDGVDEDELLGELVAGDVLRALVEQRLLDLGPSRDIVAKLHDRDDLLSPLLARSTAHDRVVHVGVVAEGGFHFLREDLFAAGVDRDRVAAEQLDGEVRALAAAVTRHGV